MALGGPNLTLARLSRGRFGPAKRRVVQKQALKGLFHGRHIQFGNKISEFGNKSRRTWKPNVQKKTVWSDLLQKEFRLRVTCKALRTIDYKGGLDNYILDTSVRQLGQGFVLELRKELEAARDAARPKQQQQQQQQQGLPESSPVLEEIRK